MHRGFYWKLWLAMQTNIIIYWYWLFPVPLKNVMIFYHLLSDSLRIINIPDKQNKVIHSYKKINKIYVYYVFGIISGAHYDKCKSRMHYDLENPNIHQKM